MGGIKRPNPTFLDIQLTPHLINRLKKDNFMEPALVSENMTDQKSTITLLFPPSLFPNHETKHFEDVFTVKAQLVVIVFVLLILE